MPTVDFLKNQEKAPIIIMVTMTPTSWVQEMVQSVYVSHLEKARVELPLKKREHPLEGL